MEEMKNEAPMSEEDCVITPPHSMYLMQRRINRQSRIVAAVTIALSAFLLAALLVSLVLELLEDEQDMTTTVIFVFFAVFLLCFGIFFKINLKKTENFEARRDYQERIRFTRDFAEVMTYRRGEVIGKEKLYYCDLFAVRQKKGLLLIYISAASAHVVDLSLLPPADVGKLHEYLRF